MEVHHGADFLHAMLLDALMWSCPIEILNIHMQDTMQLLLMEDQCVIQTVNPNILKRLEVQGIRRRVDQVARGLAREDWKELSVGTGSKGPRLFAWARIELAAPESSGWQRWLLVRRSLDEGTKPAEIAYVLVAGSRLSPLWRRWWRLPVRDGRWSSVLRKPKKKWAWMNTKSAPGRDGTVT